MTPKKSARTSSTSKSAQVRQLLQTGMTAAAIAKKVGCTVGLVYNVKSTTGQSKKRGAGRSRQPATAQGISGIVAAVKNAEREREQLHSALQRIQTIVADALA